MASNAANCFFEYMGFPVVAQSNPSSSGPTDNFGMRLAPVREYVSECVIHVTNPSALVQLVGTRIKDNLRKRNFGYVRVRRKRFYRSPAALPELDHFAAVTQAVEYGFNGSPDLFGSRATS
jgi:hypothetical protein